MRFEKFVLTLLGGAVLFYQPLQADEKLGSIEAIWNAAGIEDSSNNVSSSKQVPQQIPQPVRAQPVVNPADEKLARQRAIWKAKWDAEQKAKQQATQQVVVKPQWEKSVAVAPSPQIIRHQDIRPQNNNANHNIEFTQAELALALEPTAIIAPAPIQNTVQQVAPKPLTREQYNQRWKEQQLAQSNNPTFINDSLNKSVTQPAALPKPTYAAFKQNNQKAILNTLPQEVRTKLNAAKLKSHGMSAYVQSVNSPIPLLGHQEQTSRVPASVMKLITSYAALGTLGPNYRWPLDIMTNGVVTNGTLQGDLIVKGYGSPEFNQTELRKVLQGIKQKGIRNVNGRVVFDNSYFNVGNLPSFDGKSQSAYNAHPDALLYNERISSFQVSTKGKKVYVNTSTPTYNMKIVNRMKKTRRGCQPKIGVSNKSAQTVVTFSGNYSSGCGTRSFSRVISRPAEMIYGAMQALWKRDVGGNLQTQFVLGRAPTNAKPLLRTHSRTLAEILPTIDKDSNNVMARQVMLTIGARVKGQGTQRAGATAIGEWLASRGLNFPELRIENGSGLSRTARISARHVGDLLMDAYRSPYRDVLMQSLAVAGIDGTMKRRLKGTKVKGRGFFKTGSLRDVRSIAGYVKAADGQTYVMAILHNDPKARSRGLAAHDKLIEWVYSGGRQSVAMR